MSLFQCTHCGCIENTALSMGSRAHFNNTFTERLPDIAAAYRVVLGLPEGAPFGDYCCVCNPFWYTPKGDYGLGPNPAPQVWHEKFHRRFFPKGTVRTSRNGNVEFIATGKEVVVSDGDRKESE